MRTVLKTDLTFFFSIFLMLIHFFDVNAQGKGQWDILHEGAAEQTHSIDFVNENVGWIWGDAILYKTEDGGITWESLSFEWESGIVMLDFINETTGWGLARYYDNDISTAIIKSEDSGLTWATQKEWESDELVAISAVDDSTVYVIFERAILKTSNGGKDWIDISPNLTNTDFFDIKFLDSEVGFITSREFIGSFPIDQYIGMILITYDGGVTWDKVPFTSFGQIGDLQFTNDSTIYFLSVEKPYGFESDDEDAEFFICSTTDTFNTWSIKTQSSYPIHSLTVLDDGSIFAGMDDSISTSIFKSSDAGLSWQKKYTFNDFWNSNKIYSNKNNIGFVFCDLGDWGSAYSLMKSIDLGETWKVEKFNHWLADVFVLNPDNIFVCGNFHVGGHGPGGGQWSGDFLYSDDDGKTWNTINNGLGTLDACFFANENTVWAVGRTIDSARILATHDKGNNWTVVYENNPNSTGYYINLSDISFLNENTGWAVGSNRFTGLGVILGTTDSGKNWEVVWENGGLNSIYAIESEAWAVGDGGLIVKYTMEDQWQIQTSITDVPLNDVYFSDEQHGWITGGYHPDVQDTQSILLKTSNGGTTWSEIRLDKYLINDMFFADSLNGWIVGIDADENEVVDANQPGIILHTIDGGENWTVQIEGLSGPLSAIHFKDDVGLAVGAKGLILRYDGVSWIDQNTGEVYPAKYSLNQNYPNPFNPSTTIEFDLPKASDVIIEVYNIAGQKIHPLVSEKMTAGSHQVEFNAQNLSSGVYFYRIDAGEFQDVKKMILIK